MARSNPDNLASADTWVFTGLCMAHVRALVVMANAGWLYADLVSAPA
jgi:hypothetical protein